MDQKTGDIVNSDERNWDQAMKGWKGAGFAGDMPGNHPTKDHLWNTDKQAYLDNNGLKYTIPKEQGTIAAEEPDDY